MPSKKEISIVFGIASFIWILWKIDEGGVLKGQYSIPMGTFSGKVDSARAETVGTWERTERHPAEITLNQFLKENWKQVIVYRPENRGSIILYGVRNINGRYAGFMAKKPLNEGFFAEVYNPTVDLYAKTGNVTISVLVRTDKESLAFALLAAFLAGASIPFIATWLWKKLVAAVKI